MLGSMFTWLDSSLASLFPEMIRLALWASLSGVTSMLLYAVSSPQQRLEELKLRSAELGKQLSAYDGDFSGAMALSNQNLLLSFKRLGLALGPSLLAGLPVIVVLVGLSEVYADQKISPFGPSWFQSWITGFLVVTSLSALGTKFVFKIE